MLKQHATVYRRTMIAADVAVAGVSFLAAYFAVHAFVVKLNPLYEYLRLLPIYCALWSLLLYASGMYDSFRLKKLWLVIKLILRSGVTGFFVFVTFLFSLKMTYVSRYLVLFAFVFTACSLTLEKIALIQIFWYFRKKGHNFKNLLVVGTGPRAQKFIAESNCHRELGLKIVGLVDEYHGNNPQSVLEHHVIGRLEDIPRIIRERAVDIVIFIVPRSWLGRIEPAILYCETVGVSASVAVDFFDMKFSKGKEGQLFGLPLLTFERTTDKIWLTLIKRIMDFVLSGIALIVLAPFMAVIAVLVKTSSPGPVLFKQTRSGLNGRTFMFYKFRTMDADAEEKLESLRAHNEMKGPVFKMSHDPRVTPIGRWLRKFSLDELPQLWNVFKGEMSLVGPRPPLPQEVEKYDHWQRRRLSMRPGLTCLWQTNGRNNIKDFDHWMELDLKYIDSWSLGLDMRILAKTVPVVLFGVANEIY